MAVDVTDATFEQAVMARSEEVPVVIDLWAPWCGPCRVLGPILESVVDSTGGAVELAKVNVDENPQVSAAFRVQSIPAVFAVSRRQVVDGFVGAKPEPAVRAFVAGLVAEPSEADRLAEAGDEASLRRALELEPGHEGAIVKLASLLVERGESEEALAWLSKVPETAETRRVAALARLAASGQGVSDGSLEQRLAELLGRVEDDDDARREYLDLLETMRPDDPRREQHRRSLAARLF